MKKSKFAFRYYILAIFLLAPLADAVQISEVYYDPVGTETGGEAVEIHNPSDLTVDIGGWALMTESSSTDAMIPPGTSMPPHSFYLIADSGWSTLRDDPSWPEADHEEAITMSNTDSGIAIADAEGTIVDAVGWGDASGIAAGLFELFPAAPVLAGQSLKRMDDTDDNSFDFIASVPGLKNSSSASGVTLGVEVTSSCNLSLSSISDDDPAAGVQIIPIPGQQRLIGINISSVPGQDVSADVGASSYTLDWDGTLYSGSIPMQFHDEPGLYTMNISAGSSCSLAVEFEYFSMTALSVDVTDLDFGQIVKGQSSELLGDVSNSSGLTIRNIGNTLLDIGVYGDDLTSASATIPVSSIIFSLDNDFGSPLAAMLSSDIAVMDTDLAPAASLPLGLRLEVPQSTPDGVYSGELFIAAVGD